MNKAYLLVICLLAASFTGCLSDDTSDLEEQQNTEDETIEPVGNHNNETDDYDMLIGEIQNLTNEIEELRLEIEELQASEYQPPENSSASFTATSTTVSSYEMILDVKMINKTTIILNATSTSSLEHAVIAFYNFHGGVIMFGKVVDMYDYCEYREYVDNYDGNGTWIDSSFVYTWTEGKVNACDISDGTRYAFELPYQPTSIGFSSYLDSSGTVDYIKTFH